MELTVFITRTLPISFNCNRLLPTAGGDIEIISLLEPKVMKRYATQLRKLNIMFLNQVITSNQMLLDWNSIQNIYLPRPTKTMNWYTAVTVNDLLNLSPVYHTYC